MLTSTLLCRYGLCEALYKSKSGVQSCQPPAYTCHFCGRPAYDAEKPDNHSHSRQTKNEECSPRLSAEVMAVPPHAVPHGYRGGSTWSKSSGMHVVIAEEKKKTWAFIPSLAAVAPFLAPAATTPGFKVLLVWSRTRGTATCVCWNATPCLHVHRHAPIRLRETNIAKHTFKLEVQARGDKSGRANWGSGLVELLKIAV